MCADVSSRCAAPATPHVWVSVYQFTRPRFPRLPDESRAGSCRSAGAGRSVALAAAAAAAAAAAVGPNADCHLRCALTISARRHVLRVPRHHTQPLPHGQPLRPRAFSAPEELGALPATSLCPPPTVAQARLWRGAATPSPSRLFAPQARPASGDIAVPLPSNLRRRLVCGVMRRRGATAPFIALAPFCAAGSVLFRRPRCALPQLICAAGSTVACAAARRCYPLPSRARPSSGDLAVPSPN